VDGVTARFPALEVLLKDHPKEAVLIGSTITATLWETRAAVRAIYRLWTVEVSSAISRMEEGLFNHVKNARTSRNVTKSQKKVNVEAGTRLAVLVAKLVWTTLTHREVRMWNSPKM